MRNDTFERTSSTVKAEKGFYEIPPVSPIKVDMSEEAIARRVKQAALYSAVQRAQVVLTPERGAYSDC